MQTNHGVIRKAWSRRPAFLPKQNLTAEQLNAGLEDELKRQRILNRATYGYGVVIGYGLSVRDDGALVLQKGHLQLGKGLALDRHGRMLVWEGGWIGMDDIVGEPPENEGPYTLIAHYAVRAPDRGGCLPFGQPRPSWIEEGVVFTLNRLTSADDDCCPDHPGNRCVGHGEFLHRRNGGLPIKEPSVDESPDVEWYSKEPGQTRDACRDGWEYDPDPRVGVPLARVEICDLVGGEKDEQDCERRYGFCPDKDKKPEVVAVRPLVYRNPLLYELTRCCDADLPRVEKISWQEWIQDGWDAEVPWEDFAGVVADPSRGLEVWFTRPLDPGSLHEASVFVTVFYQGDDAAWRNYRMPLSDLVPLELDKEVRGIRLVPDQDDWVPSEVTGRQSHLFHGTRIEVTIRGQLLHDNCGRMLDARRIGAECGIRCQARPGGDLITTFQVGPHHRDRNASDPNNRQTTSDQNTGTSRDVEGV
jgi:hypothetical protein